MNPRDDKTTVAEYYQQLREKFSADHAALLERIREWDASGAGNQEPRP